MKRILFTAAALIGAAGTSLALALPASASTAIRRPIVPNATTTCGASCNDLFNLALGEHVIQNAPLGTYGSVVDLAPAHNFLKSEDFVATEVGTLDQMIDNGLISKTSYVALNYPDFWPVFENEYAPYSVTSGLCIAVRKHDVKPGAPITLRDCGSSARTLWVGDLANSVPDSDSVFGFDSPWVDGADKAFSHALSLTTDGGGNLSLQELAKNGGIVNDNQEFGVNFGPAF